MSEKPGVKLKALRFKCPAANSLAEVCLLKNKQDASSQERQFDTFRAKDCCVCFFCPFIFHFNQDMTRQETVTMALNLSF